MMNIRKILPMELNFEIRNFWEYWKKSTVKISDNREKKRIFYLDAPSYRNLGDQAIAYAISVFLQIEFPDFEYIEVSENELIRNLGVLKRIIRRQDIICLSGGGNMGTYYPRYEALRRKVIKNFPNNPIVIFPQTIDYERDGYGKYELQRSKAVYNAHQHLFIFAREMKSYRAMQGLYGNVFLAPDIVFYLKDKIVLKSPEKGDRVGVCLREDKESVLTEEERNEIILEAGRLKESVITLDTLGGLTDFGKINRLELLENKLEEFLQCGLIITDRLHGMVFATLLSIPCIIIDNSNGKVSGVYELMEGKVQNVRILDKNNLTSLYEITEQVKKAKPDWNIGNEYAALVKQIKKAEILH